MKMIYLFISLFITPIFIDAQILSRTTSLANGIFNLINTLIPVGFMLALLFFFWGIAKYIYSEGEGKGEGKKIMVWGVVAMFVISSVWGLVFFLRVELGLTNNPQSLPIPRVGN